MLAQESSARVILHWVDCPLKVAIKRNLQRERQVPVNIITALYNSFEAPSTAEGLDVIRVYDQDKRPVKTITKKMTVVRGGVIRILFPGAGKPNLSAK